MKNSIKIFVTIAIIAIGMASCKKDSEVIDSTPQITSPDAGKTEDDKPNAVQDSIKQSRIIMEPLKAEDRIETGALTKNSLTVAPQGRVKVIVTLKSIWNQDIDDGYRDTQEELYGTISSSLCESIAPNNDCLRSAHFRPYEGLCYQKTQSRYFSSVLFDEDRPNYLKFNKNTTVYTNSYQVYDYSYSNAYYPNIKLWENIKENDGNKTDDNYRFLNGTPTIYLAGLSFNDVHTRSFALGDGSSWFVTTVTIQKIYY